MFEQGTVGPPTGDGDVIDDRQGQAFVQHRLHQYVGRQ